MPFSDSTESVTITKGVLSAQCKKADNKSSIQSSISLNDYIGNVDGKLTWGGRGFSNDAEAVQVVKGVLSAKLKSKDGKSSVESKLDLNQYIRNVDGVLGVIPPVASVDTKKIDVGKASALSAPALVTTESSGSAASASALFSAASASSHSVASSVSASSIKKSYSSSSYFSTSQFKTSSKHLVFEDTCHKLELKNTYLHAHCDRLDGSVNHSASIDLNQLIGFVDGYLEWDLKGFKDHCFESYLDGFFLVVKCYDDEGKYHHDSQHHQHLHGKRQHECAHHGGVHVNGKPYHPLKHHHGKDFHNGRRFHTACIDLRTRLCNANGILIIVELNKKLSVMLSEVPWMKFKVIAEPDLNIFARNAVMKETLAHIAETTVEHVTRQMHERLTIAMEIAIKLVTESAMTHVHAEMERLVSDAVGYASASASITAAEALHIYGGGRGGYGYAGHAGYGHTHFGHGYAPGHLNGQHHEEHYAHKDVPIHTEAQTYAVAHKDTPKDTPQAVPAHPVHV